ncbi:MAG: pyridoxal phosphate-dependent aminotransferase [Bacteroidales bacterium]|nr:pyridoxal phosphate-dependent aminotransferase [Bacteroidales bacterium]
MIKYDFDTVIDRRNTGTIKYDTLLDRFGRSDLIPLWIADMEFATPPEIVEALLQRFAHPVYGYSCPPESYWQSIIDWLSHRHGIKVEREDLAFVPGIVRGVGYAVNFFTQPGDKVVIQPPVYHPFRMVTEGNHRVVVNNPLILDEEGHTYRMDLEGLERIFAEERPKLMVLCNPHNPGGVQWDEDTLRRLAQLAYRYGVIIVSDEIHGDLMLDGKRHIPFASVSDEAKKVSVSFGAPSKTFNIPGLVSSWMLCYNPEIREPFYQWMEANEFSAPFFTAFVATETAYTQCEEWLNQALSYIQGNIDAVEEWFKTNIPEIKVMRPDASFLLWLDCRDLHLSQEELVNLFVNEAHLALNDGTMFGPGGEGFMRLNVAMPRNELLKALAHLLVIHASAHS